MRECGDCQLCCKLLPLTTIGKKQGERCKHQKHGVGCAIYGEFGRPISCTAWGCQWLVDPTFETRRPDRAGFFIDPTPEFITWGPEATTGKVVRAVRVWVDPARPYAHRDRALRNWLEAQAEEQAIVAVCWIGDESIVVVPPKVAGDGKGWRETPGRPMKPLSVGEIRKNIINERLERVRAMAEAGGGPGADAAGLPQNVSRETPEE